MVRLRPEIEPVVRWIEETPREKVFEKAVAELKAGLSYRTLLGGLFLAGIRNIQPRPVGFKFHAVMVINSAHMLGQSAPFSERLLPLFWALDNFKSSQAQDVKEGDWALGPVDEARVPKPHQAKADFVKAMEAWDVDAADVAVAGLCRGSGAAEAMEPFWRMGVRDQRDIGHKAIFTAQSWRTLQAIGWENAEPVLRCLAYGLLDLGGDRPGPVGPYAANLENAGKIRDDWQVGRVGPRRHPRAARNAPPGDARGRLGRGRQAAGAGDRPRLDLGRRRPAFERADHAQSRHHRDPRDDVGELAALHLRRQRRRYDAEAGAAPGGRLAADVPRADQVAQAADDRRAARRRRRPRPATRRSARSSRPSTPTGGGAAAKTMAYLDRGGSTKSVFDAASRMIFHKGTDSHDYKYGAAIWEECLAASDPKWQPRLAAAAMFNLPGAGKADSP